MLQKTVLVGQNREVLVDYFHFSIPHETEKNNKKQENYKAFLIAQLNYVVDLLKSPFFYSLDLVNGNNISRKSSSVNPALGVIGILATLPSFAMGVLLEKSRINFEEEQVKYYRSPYFHEIYQKAKATRYGTWNIAMLPNFLCNDSRLEEAKKRLPFIIQMLRNAASEVDVIFLQEAFFYQKEIIAGLEDLYGYFLYDMAPEPYFLKNNGFMIISKVPPKEGYFYRPPLPLVTPVDNENEYSHIFCEGVTNKGFVKIFFEDDNILIGGHLKSNASTDPAKQAMIEQLRKDFMVVAVHETRDFNAELKAKGENPKSAVFCGDTNASNEEEDGQITYQRDKNAFFFNLFPNPPQKTWVGGQNDYHKNDRVTFDHIGACPLNGNHNDDKKELFTPEFLPCPYGPISDHLYLYERSRQKTKGVNNLTESFNSSPASKPIAVHIEDVGNLAGLTI